MIRKGKRRIMTAVCAVLALQTATAQDTRSMPPVVLRIDTANFVRYDQDTTDWTRLATAPGIATPLPFAAPAFASYVAIGDVVAVNGRPVKGVRVLRGLNVAFAKNPAPKQAVADLTGNPYFDQYFVIQDLDGSVIGTLAITGLQITDPAPATSGLNGWGQVVVGGTGAFLGVTGQGCGVSGGGTRPGGERRTSVTEDPANRQVNGGGSTFSVLCLIPLVRPQVVSTQNGPAVVHSNDFSLVTSAKPAKAGELLTLFATGLGPTRPGVDPGQAFASDPLQRSTSPVDITVNGAAAEVLYSGGYPGTSDVYQVNFRAPSAVTPGLTKLQISAAWIPGPEITIAVQ